MIGFILSLGCGATSAAALMGAAETDAGQSSAAKLDADVSSPSNSGTPDTNANPDDPTPVATDAGSTGDAAGPIAVPTNFKELKVLWDGEAANRVADQWQGRGQERGSLSVGQTAAHSPARAIDFHLVGRAYGEFGWGWGTGVSTTDWKYLVFWIKVAPMTTGAPLGFALMTLRGVNGQFIDDPNRGDASRGVNITKYGKLSTEWTQFAIPLADLVHGKAGYAQVNEILLGTATGDKALNVHYFIDDIAVAK